MDKESVRKYAKASILLEQSYEEAKRDIMKGMKAKPTPTGRPQPNEWQLANAPQINATQSMAPTQSITPRQLEEVAMSNPIRTNDRGPY